MIELLIFINFFVKYKKELAVKLILSLAIFTFFSFGKIQSSESHDISTCLAKGWSDLKSYKDTVYIPFFEKAGFDKEYLEERWNYLRDLYKTELVSIMLLQKEAKPVGFMTVETKKENGLLYTSPVLLPLNEIEYVLKTLFVKQYPEVDNLYCLAKDNSPKLEKTIQSLGFKQIQNDKLPIKPNEQFMDKMPFISFEKNLKN